jgi:hypothetical protein
LALAKTRVQSMIGRVFKGFILGIGAALAATVVVLGVLIILWGRSAARTEKDVLVQQKLSPDNALVAEIHTFTTAMHGGPDKLYVTLRQVDRPFGYKVYERTYECDDLSAFGLRWESPFELTIAYGACDAGHEQGKGKYREFYLNEENKVWRSDTAWQRVKINYIDTKYVATR